MNKIYKNKLLIIVVILVSLILIEIFFAFFLQNKVKRLIEIRLNEAQQMVESKKYDYAVEEYAFLLENDPSNIDAYIGIVDMCTLIGEQQNDYNKRMILLEKAKDVAKIGYELTGSEVLDLKIDFINNELDMVFSEINSQSNKKEDIDTIPYSGDTFKWDGVDGDLNEYVIFKESEYIYIDKSKKSGCLMVGDNMVPCKLIDIDENGWITVDINGKTGYITPEKVIVEKKECDRINHLLENIKKETGLYVWTYAVADFDNDKDDEVFAFAGELGFEDKGESLGHMMVMKGIVSDDDGCHYKKDSETDSVIAHLADAFEIHVVDIGGRKVLSMAELVAHNGMFYGIYPQFSTLIDGKIERLDAAGGYGFFIEDKNGKMVVEEEQSKFDGHYLSQYSAIYDEGLFKYGFKSIKEEEFYGFKGANEAYKTAIDYISNNGVFTYFERERKILTNKYFSDYPYVVAQEYYICDDGYYYINMYFGKDDNSVENVVHNHETYYNSDELAAHVAFGLNEKSELEFVGAYQGEIKLDGHYVEFYKQDNL